MWHFSIGGDLINLSRLDYINIHQTQEGKFVLMGRSTNIPVRLSLHDSQEEAREALIVLRNQRNRVVKAPR